MRKYSLLTLLVFVVLSCMLVAFAGCSSKVEEEAPQKITANVNNDDPRAKTAQGAPTDESPAALAARMNGGKAGVGAAKKMGR